MKPYFFLITLIIFCLDTVAQSAYKVSFRDLKTFEGTYAYNGNTTLQIAASPKDTLLYALIGSAKYKLCPYGKDVFLNSTNQQVQFVRSGSKIVGFKVKDDQPDKLYQILSTKVNFSDKIWFPRPLGEKYRYAVPKQQHDGLPSGQLSESGLDTNLIQQMIERIIKGTYPDVHGILLVKDGKLVLEEYFYEYDSHKLHQLRSASKTFISALVGIANDQGFIQNLNDPVLPFFPEYQLANLSSEKKAITIKNMLTQQSGLACNDYDPNSLGNETKIYPSEDWVKSVLDLPMTEIPGQKANYCSGNTMVLGRIVEKASRLPLKDFANKYLFAPMGIRNFQWNFVLNQSNQDDFGQLHLAPRDMAKFGLLYLNKGKWNGKQIISPRYITESLSQHSVVSGINYGYLWWLESLVSNEISFKGMAAKGNGGQRIFLWPELNMLAVITSGNYNTQSSSNKMLIECVLKGIKK